MINWLWSLIFGILPVRVWSWELGSMNRTIQKRQQALLPWCCCCGDRFWSDAAGVKTRKGSFIGYVRCYTIGLVGQYSYLCGWKYQSEYVCLIIDSYCNCWKQKRHEGAKTSEPRCIESGCRWRIGNWRILQEGKSDVCRDQCNDRNGCGGAI